jgi:glycosyltransferase involved in cell wall biosynthesis
MFENHPRITLRGAVPNLGLLYNSHRLFVAPTRYAAGAPYKVLEAAAHGLPVVATELLGDELGWTPGEDILTAPVTDPVAFAAAVVTAYRSEELWCGVRNGALRRLERENGREAFARAVTGVLGQATRNL